MLFKVNLEGNKQLNEGSHSKVNHAVLLRAVVGVEVYEYLVVPLSEVLLGYSGMEITWTGQRFLCPLSNTAATLSVPGRRGGWICMAPAFMLKTSLERCERANALIYYKKMPNAWQQNKENPSPSLSVSTGVVCVCVCTGAVPVPAVPARERAHHSSSPSWAFAALANSVYETWFRSGSLSRDC